MKRLVYRLAPVLMLLLLPLAGCTSTRGPASGTLTQGLAQGGADTRATASGGARVVEVKPGVVSIFGGRAEQLRTGMNVPLSAILRSDATGKARLALPDGSTVNVAPDTEIALADFADSPEQQNSGGGLSKGLARVFSGGTAADSTPQATIGIRGLQAR